MLLLAEKQPAKPNNPNFWINLCHIQSEYADFRVRCRENRRTKALRYRSGALTYTLVRRAPSLRSSGGLDPPDLILRWFGRSGRLPLRSGGRNGRRGRTLWSTAVTTATAGTTATPVGVGCRWHCRQRLVVTTTAGRTVHSSVVTPRRRPDVSGRIVELHHLDYGNGHLDYSATFQNVSGAAEEILWGRKNLENNGRRTDEMAK